MNEPLRASRSFFKGHGLGNDYLVFRQEAGGWPVVPEAIRRICHREEGVGSDGIVVLLAAPEASVRAAGSPGGAGGSPGERGSRRGAPDRPFRLRMFNPDGSEFERSGNGLRVLGAFLLAEGEVGAEDFLVTSGGAEIRMEVLGRERAGVSRISVEMGRAALGPEVVGLDSGHPDVREGRIVHPERGLLDLRMVSVGNPHCVLFTEGDPEETVDELGAYLAVHPALGRGTNVQIARVDRDGRLTIAIWERGVGRTAASGTSSCAAAVAAVAGGLASPGTLEVRMAGGVLHVEVTQELDVVLRGPVQEICRGEVTPAFAESLG